MADAPQQNNDNKKVKSQLKIFHKQAFACIDKALSLDEAGDAPQALKYYEEGLTNVELGLAVQLSDDMFKEKELQRKLASNKEMIVERLESLRISARDGKPQPAPSSSSSKHPRSSKDPAGGKGPSLGTPSPQTKATSTNPTTQKELDKNSTKNNAKPSSKNISSTDKQKIGAYLKNVDPKMAELILNEIVDDQHVSFDDVIGLDSVKDALREIVIYPALRPELFTGLRAPAKGLLLYGPPGNGKTLIAKAVATEAKAKFFSISASTLTSKYLGESEKMVRALFAVAREVQPSIIFIDEIDSIMTARSSEEHEASRRLKTEILVQFDGVKTVDGERVLVMAATNLPDQLDEAALRRFAKRVYIPMPDLAARTALISSLVAKMKGVNLSSRDVDWVAKHTEGYSGSDLTALARDAALGPIRELGPKIATVAEKDVRHVDVSDFHASLRSIRPSVSPESLKEYERFTTQHGAI